MTFSDSSQNRTKSELGHNLRKYRRCIDENLSNLTPDVLSTKKRFSYIGCFRYDIVKQPADQASVRISDAQDGLDGTDNLDEVLLDCSGKKDFSRV